jgi:hypothetical protein
MSDADAAWDKLYPEQAKLRQVKHKNQTIAAFMNWLQYTEGIAFCIYDSVRGYVPVNTPFSTWLASYAHIDQQKLDKEREAMLAAIRKASAERRQST